MLLQSQLPDDITPRSKAFQATVSQFNIDLNELARVSGVNIKTITDFHKGKNEMTTRSLSRLLIGLTATESAFYSAMVRLQIATIESDVELPLLRFRDIVDITDIYRQAYSITVGIFNIVQTELGKKAKIEISNISAWNNGRRDLQISSLDRIESAFSIYERMVFIALVDVLFIVGADKMSYLINREDDK